MACMSPDRETPFRAVKMPWITYWLDIFRPQGAWRYQLFGRWFGTLVCRILAAQIFVVWSDPILWCINGDRFASEYCMQHTQKWKYPNPGVGRFLFGLHLFLSSLKHDWKLETDNCSDCFSLMFSPWRWSHWPQWFTLLILGGVSTHLSLFLHHFYLSATCCTNRVVSGLWRQRWFSMSNKANGVWLRVKYQRNEILLHR